MTGEPIGAGSGRVTQEEEGETDPEKAKQLRDVNGSGFVGTKEMLDALRANYSPKQV